MDELEFDMQAQSILEPEQNMGLEVEDSEADVEFVDKLFYLEPPSVDASPEEWQKWLVSDRRKRASDKGQHTKSLQNGNLSDLPHFSPGGTVCIGGVHRQQTAAIGVGGDWESGQGTMDIMVPASQGRYFQARGKRGKRAPSAERNASRRRSKKQKRADRFKGLGK